MAWEGMCPPGKETHLKGDRPIQYNLIRNLLLKFITVLQLEPSSIFAGIVVIGTLFLLGYFAWKTLITANLYQKGLNLYQEKDLPAAEVVLRQIIAINSTNDVVRLLLGDVLMQQEKVEEAIEVYVDVQTRSPKNPDAWVRLAQIEMRKDKPDVAKSYLQRAKELLQKQRQPERAERIGKLLEKMG
jgi:tetratricopeptide (TPR) repeat protein